MCNTHNMMACAFLLLHLACLCQSFHSLPSYVQLQLESRGAFVSKMSSHRFAVQSRTETLNLARMALGEGSLCDKRVRGRFTALQTARQPSQATDDASEEEAYEETSSYSMMTGLEAEERPSDKVRVFGANLDSKFTSRGRGLQNYEDEEITSAMMDKALAATGGDLEAAKRWLQVQMGKLSEAESHFRIGVKSMQNGQYNQAVDAFTKAIATTPEGPLSREGGQYTIWLSQALAAKGERAKAIRVIRTIKGHSDADIRRVADGVEFIYAAPDLATGKEQFQWIELEKLEEIKAGPKQRLYAKMEKVPEKYSLEWYMLQTTPKKPIGNGQDAQLALAGSALALAALVAYGQFAS